MLRVLLVTTWNVPCGIAAHSAYLKAAVESADPSITLQPWDRLGGPDDLPSHRDYDLVHLNYHNALHSQWTPDRIRFLQGLGVPVVATLHDTGVPCGDQVKGIHAAANASVIHEPAEDLPGAVYWRQGVPPWQGQNDEVWDDLSNTRAWDGQPILGTVGFPFPWKHYDLLAEATAAAGWALLLLAPGATPAQVATWRSLNPAMLAVTDFIPADAVVAYLGGCDATAFLYGGCGTGTSGAIRQGIAARKPVIAAAECRQFRDLSLDGHLGQSAIEWIDVSVTDLVWTLANVIRIERVNPGIVALAHRDSWATLGQRYAELYHAVLRQAR